MITTVLTQFLYLKYCKILKVQQKTAKVVKLTIVIIWNQHCWMRINRKSVGIG